MLQELKDQGIDIIMKPIGRDALVFFTNQKNKASNLTQKQIQNIYTGKITNWKFVGGKNAIILPYQRDAESGSQVLMQKLVMGDLKMMTPKKDYMITSGIKSLVKVRFYLKNPFIKYKFYSFFKTHLLKIFLILKKFVLLFL